jgi:hypothetical protein
MESPNNSGQLKRISRALAAVDPRRMVETTMHVQCGERDPVSMRTSILSGECISFGSDDLAFLQDKWLLSAS